MNIVVSGEGFGERPGAGVALGLVRGAATQGEAGQGGHRILPTLLEPSGEICHEEPSVTSRVAPNTSVLRYSRIVGTE